MKKREDLIETLCKSDDPDELETLVGDHADMLSAYDLRGPSIEAAKRGSKSVRLYGRLYVLSDLPDSWVRDHLAELVTRTIKRGDPELGRELYEELKDERPPAVTDDLFSALVKAGHERQAFDLFNRDPSALRPTPLKIAFEEPISTDLAGPMMNELVRRVKTDGTAVSERDINSVMTKLGEEGNQPVIEYLLDQRPMTDPREALETAVKWSGNAELVDELMNRLESGAEGASTVDPAVAERAIRGGADAVMQTLFDHDHIPTNDNLELLFSTSDDSRNNYVNDETVRRAIEKRANFDTHNTALNIDPLGALLQSDRSASVINRGIDFYAGRPTDPERLGERHLGDLTTDQLSRLIDGRMLEWPGLILSDCSADEQKAIMGQISTEGGLDLLRRAASNGRDDMVDKIFKHGPDRIEAGSVWHVGEEYFSDVLSPAEAGRIPGIGQNRHIPITHEEVASIEAMTSMGSARDETRYLNQSDGDLHPAIRVAIETQDVQLVEHLGRAGDESEKLFEAVRDADDGSAIKEALGTKPDFERVLELVRAEAAWSDDRKILKRAIEHEHYTLSDELLDRDYKPSAAAFYEAFESAHDGLYERILDHYDPDRNVLVRAVNKTLQDEPESAPRVLDRIERYEDHDESDMDWQFNPGRGSGTVAQPPLAFVIDDKRGEDCKLPLLKQLIDAGARPGEHAYKKALKFDDRDSLSVLLQGDPDPAHHDLAHEAIRQGSSDVLEHLLQQYEPGSDGNELYVTLCDYTFNELAIEPMEFTTLVYTLTEQSVNPGRESGKQLLRRIVDQYHEKSSWSDEVAMRSVRRLARALNRVGRFDLDPEVAERAHNTPIQDVLSDELRDRQIKGLETLTD